VDKTRNVIKSDIGSYLFKNKRAELRVLKRRRKGDEGIPIGQLGQKVGALLQRK
jgi:hypothetical protein